MDPGFREQGVVNLKLDLRPRHYERGASLAVFDRMLAEARATPGVKSATLASVVLLEGSNTNRKFKSSAARPTETTRRKCRSSRWRLSTSRRCRSRFFAAERSATRTSAASFGRGDQRRDARISGDGRRRLANASFAGTTTPTYEIIGVAAT